MGCNSSKSAKSVIRFSSSKSVINELDDIADLAIQNQDEDSGLSNTVELFMKCSDLPNFDSFSLSDPMIVFFTRNEQGDWVEQGRTEIKKNSLNPEFANPIRIFYSFEKAVKCKIEVYNINNFDRLDSLLRQTLIGSVVCNIHEIVCAPENTFTRQLYSKKRLNKYNGTVTVISEESSVLARFVGMKWALVNTKLKGNLFLKFYRCGDNEVLIYQTEGRPRTSLEWDKIEISLHKLCLDDEAMSLKVDVLREGTRKDDKVMGTAHFTFSEIKGGDFSIELYDATRVVGELVLEFINLEEKYSFLDYIFGGCEVSLVIGIDFTASNGNINSPNSLHFFTEDQPNEYMQAIQAVGSILQYYDSDKKIPVFGFGGKLPPSYSVISHCFALNGDIFDPEVNGIEEVLQLYKRKVHEIPFHGPTVFSEVIRTASLYASAADASQEHQQYFILLIITDGVINDVGRTVDAITYASDLPISVIIVGVGDADFSLMEFFDADEEPLFSKQLLRSPSRDIVQFVPFAQFRGNPTELAREVLCEVPTQLLEFMKSRGIKPNPCPLHKQGEVPVSKQFTRNESIGSPKDVHTASMLLTESKHRFVGDVVRLGFDRDIVSDVIMEGVMAMDMQLAIELTYQRIRNIRKKNEMQKKRRRKNSSRRGSVEQIIRNCFVCGSQANAVLEECGHLITCADCIETLQGTCPACNAKITSWKTHK